MGTYIRDASVIQIVQELTPGTFLDPSTELYPTVVLPIEKGGELWSPKVEKDETNPETPYHGSKETDINAMFASIEESVSMKLPADHTMAAMVLAMCGLVGTAFAGGTSYAYSSASKTTASIKQIALREHTSVFGARATFGISCEVGKAAVLNFDFKSQLHEAVALDAADPDNTLPAVPAIAKVYMTRDCTAYLVNGQEAHFKKIDFKLGGEVRQPKDTCPGACYTEDIKPELQVSMAADPTNNGAFQELKNGDEFNFVIPLFDIDGNKVYELISPKCVIMEQKKPKNEGLINLDRTYECRRVNGDDNFEIKVYHA